MSCTKQDYLGHECQSWESWDPYQGCTIRYLIRGEVEILHSEIYSELLSLEHTDDAGYLGIA